VTVVENFFRVTLIGTIVTFRFAMTEQKSTGNRFTWYPQTGSDAASNPPVAADPPAQPPPEAAPPNPRSRPRAGAQTLRLPVDFEHVEVDMTHFGQFTNPCVA
jgi:hypothetical protein